MRRARSRRRPLDRPRRAPHSATIPVAYAEVPQATKMVPCALPTGLSPPPTAFSGPPPPLRPARAILVDSSRTLPTALRPISATYSLGRLGAARPGCAPGDSMRSPAGRRAGARRIARSGPVRFSRLLPYAGYPGIRTTFPPCTKHSRKNSSSAGPPRAPRRSSPGRRRRPQRRTPSPSCRKVPARTRGRGPASPRAVEGQARGRRVHPLDQRVRVARDREVVLLFERPVHGPHHGGVFRDLLGGRSLVVRTFVASPWLRHASLPRERRLPRPAWLA